MNDAKTINANVIAIANTDTVSVTVKSFSLADMREIARAAGVATYGSRATIAYRIQRKHRGA